MEIENEKGRVRADDIDRKMKENEIDRASEERSGLG